jgi:hypothetical protein
VSQTGKAGIPLTLPARFKMSHETSGRWSDVTFIFENFSSVLHERLFHFLSGATAVSVCFFFVHQSENGIQRTHLSEADKSPAGLPESLRRIVSGGRSDR